MPPHALLGVAAITLACVAAVLGFSYAIAINGRRALRWPLVGLSVLAAACATAAGGSGKPLLARVEANGSVAEVAAAQVTAAALVTAAAVLVGALDAVAIGHPSWGLP